MYRHAFLAVVLGALVSCGPQELPEGPKAQHRAETYSPLGAPAPLKTYEMTAGPLNIVMRQTIFVPAYARVHDRQGRPIFDLVATATARNTDFHHPIFLTSVTRYGPDGTLLEQYVKSPLELAPLASMDFVAERAAPGEASGSSFMVEWVAQNKVTEPVVEALMISTASMQGISFICEGRVIRSRVP